MKTTKSEDSPNNPQKAGSMTRLVRRFRCTPKCPHCGYEGYSVPYGMAPQLYECNKCKGTWTADMMEMEEIIEDSDVPWEYEDQIPPMDREKFDAMIHGLNQIRSIARNSQTQTTSIMRIAMIVESILPNAERIRATD